LRGQPRRERRGSIPEPNYPAAVEQEDPVTDRLEHLRRLLPFGRHGAGCRLGRLEAPPLLLEARVPDGCSHLCDQAVDQLEVVGGVFATVGHQLHDADDAPFVLDRHHHRGRRLGRAGVGNPLDVPFRVDVVIDAGDLRNALRNVVEEQRLAALDHATLHAAAFAVQRERRQHRRVEHGAVRPRVLAADQLVAVVVGRDEQAVVLDDVGDELVEPLVDPLRLYALAEPPSGVQEEFGDLRFPPQFAVVHFSDSSALLGGVDVSRRSPRHPRGDV
jgi:hypothetical protein